MRVLYTIYISIYVLYTLERCTIWCYQIQTIGSEGSVYYIYIYICTLHSRTLYNLMLSNTKTIGSEGAVHILYIYISIYVFCSPDLIRPLAILKNPFQSSNRSIFSEMLTSSWGSINKKDSWSPLCLKEHKNKLENRCDLKINKLQLTVYRNWRIFRTSPYLFNAVA